MRAANLWIAFSAQAITEFKANRSEPDYDGPMDQQTFNIMSKMADLDTVQRMFKSVTASGKTYTLFSMVITANLGAAKEAIDDITAKWPAHIIVVGAWDFDTGLQAGTEYDEEGEVTGTPLYPIPATAYKIMPDTVTYTEAGEVDTVTPASSNADLRDVNLVYGQAPRRFV